MADDAELLSAVVEQDDDEVMRALEEQIGGVKAAAKASSSKSKRRRSSAASAGASMTPEDARAAASRQTASVAGAHDRMSQEAALTQPSEPSNVLTLNVRTSVPDGVGKNVSLQMPRTTKCSALLNWCIKEFFEHTETDKLPSPEFFQLQNEATHQMLTPGHTVGDFCTTQAVVRFQYTA